VRTVERTARGRNKKKPPTKVMDSKGLIEERVEGSSIFKEGGLRGRGEKSIYGGKRAQGYKEQYRGLFFKREGIRTDSQEKKPLATDLIHRANENRRSERGRKSFRRKKKSVGK